MGASARATTPPWPGAVEDRNPSKLGALRSGPRSGAAPVAPSARRRAGEDHRLRMGPLVDPWIRIRPRPVLLVGRPVEVDVGAKAAVDVHDPGVLAGDATDVVAVETARIVRAGYRAVEVLVERGAVLEMADLVRECDVVRMRRPRVAPRIGGAVLGVERVGRRVTSVRRWLVQHVREPLFHRT